MKIDIYGGPQYGGWSAHGEWEEGDIPLLPCPFCGSTDDTVSNTHTPFYTASCGTCDAEGPRDYRDGEFWTPRVSKDGTERIHRKAFSAAIFAWNRRWSA